MLIAVAPSAALDRTLLVDSLDVGGINRPTSVIELGGGKGLNVARAAHRLGSDVTGLTILSGWTGSAVSDGLAAEGIRLSAVTGRSATRVCTTVVDSSTGESTDLYEPAPQIAGNEWNELVDRAQAMLASGARWLSVSGSMPAGVPADGLAALLNAAHAAGARVAVDTHGAALHAALAFGPDIVKVNAREAAEALGSGQGDVLSLAQALRERGGVQHAIVTDGARGAYAVSERGAWFAAPSHVGAYPIGSGDTFLAGLVLGLGAGDDLAGALALATAAASENTRVPGAAVFDGPSAHAAARMVVVDPVG